ncbi:hypothetical protein Goari_003394 [Gossypium aridum]|uniref:HMA domain-containing protein n=1 Tax=Gossypium aridum TaxID=34290 RepID=A0A7J8YCV6_GOSAI|nr:hypothetical protein [Gossypium aridum]
MVGTAGGLSFEHHVTLNMEEMVHRPPMTVVLKVGMSCEGCVGAVKRVLGKMQGVESYEVDLKEQKVTVKGNVQPDAVLQTVSKTGKKTTFWEGEAPAEAETKPATA